MLYGNSQKVEKKYTQKQYLIKETEYFYQNSVHHWLKYGGRGDST